jgi:hypothetical protein
MPFSAGGLSILNTKVSFFAAGVRICRFSSGVMATVTASQASIGVSSMGEHMLRFSVKVLSLTASTLMVTSAISSAQSMDELVATAKADSLRQRAAA